MNIRHSTLPCLDLFLHILAHFCHWRESTVETSRGTSSMRHAIAIWNFWSATWCGMNLSDSSSFTNNRSHYHWQTMRCVLLRIKNHIKQLCTWQVLQKLHLMNFGWLWPLWHPALCISQHVHWLVEYMCVDMAGMFCPATFFWLWGAPNFECPALTSDLYRSLWISRTLSCLLHCKKQCLSGTNPFLAASNQGVLLSHMTIATAGLHGFVQLLSAFGPVWSRQGCLQLYLVWTWADVNVVWT